MDNMVMQSIMHPYLNWAKELLNEMDAAIASLEEDLCEVKAGTRAMANLILGQIQKKRDHFQDVI